MYIYGSYREIKNGYYFLDHCVVYSLRILDVFVCIAGITARSLGRISNLLKVVSILLTNDPCKLRTAVFHLGLPSVQYYSTTAV